MPVYTYINWPYSGCYPIHQPHSTTTSQTTHDAFLTHTLNVMGELPFRNVIKLFIAQLDRSWNFNYP